MSRESMLRKISNDLRDTSVWVEINAQGGGTAYFLSNCLKIDRVLVSASLQRLKRRGEVTNQGSYWKPAPIAPIA